MNKPLPQQAIPQGNWQGFLSYFQNDILSGFLVFLIALPLCIAISIASGFPAIAGIFTAIVGAFIATFISNSEMTIKGPAAGLIVIVVGCVTDFKAIEVARGLTESDAQFHAYKAALAVGVVAAILQILFGLLRAGILGEFFPLAAVHGMLAAIGVIIISKQVPVALGADTHGIKEPLELIQHIPKFILDANPAIACIGGISLAIMFLWPLVTKRVLSLKIVPAPLIVLMFAVPMGMWFDLMHAHSYTVRDHQYHLSEAYLVKMPEKMFGMFDDITFPNFTVLNTVTAWKWIMMFFIIGTLESLLSAKAVSLLDPWKRKTNMNRDVLGVGVANLVAALIGGLPMISEIVRSKANIDNGARTRFANFWHGVFLLICVALAPMVLHRIPVAALAAMLIYTGYRLAHPNEFLHVYRIGKEQLAIFVTTLLVVLASDLLVGVAAGILLKIIIHVANGVPLRSLFLPYLEVQDVDENTSLIVARESAVFSNWIPFRRQIEQIGLVQRRNVIVDVSDARLVDHSVMEKLEEMRRDFEQEGLNFEIRGLDALRPLSENARAARKRALIPMRRITVVAEQALEDTLEKAMIQFGATGYTVIPCSGIGRRQVEQGDFEKTPCVRIEAIISHHSCEAILHYLRYELPPDVRLTTCVETVNVIRSGHFERTGLQAAKEHSVAH